MLQWYIKGDKSYFLQDRSDQARVTSRGAEHQNSLEELIRMKLYSPTGLFSPCLSAPYWCAASQHIVMSMENRHQGLIHHRSEDEVTYRNKLTTAARNSD